MKNIDKKIIDTLDHDFALANTHLQIARELIPVIKKENQELNQYFEYFIFSYLAHAQTSIILFAKYFDIDSRSYSLTSVINMVGDPGEVVELKREYKLLQKNFKLFENYRNKILAHFDINSFSSAITLPNPQLIEENLDEFAEDFKKLINKIREKLNFNDRWIEIYPGALDRYKKLILNLKSFSKYPNATFQI